MRKLSATQRKTLEVLRDADGPRGSYPGLSLGTLNALALRGLVKAKRGVGSIALPHTSIKWSITDAGKVAIFTL